MNLEGIGWKCVDWIQVAADSWEHDNEPPGSTEHWECLD
jgi:hypothetical protein